MKMFHVKRFAKTLVRRGFFVFLAVMLFTACIAPKHTIEINDYILMENGKEVLGREKGLTAFIFENNQRKMPFRQFIVEKYSLGYAQDIQFNVDIDGVRYTVFLYTNDELEKYFDATQFMSKNFENEANRITTVNFLALSVISESNEDCLAENSLHRSVVIGYLKRLKDEYYNS